MITGTLKEWKGTSWLLGGTITEARLKTLVVALHVAAGVLTLASALAIAFGPAAQGWWSSLAVAGSAVGIAAFAAFWDGHTKRLIEEGALGAGISLILLVCAVFPGAFDR